MDESGAPKSMAYAIATQQAHKVGKSPKGFRTPQGVHEAKVKFDRPKKEYQKTAGLTAKEKTQITNKSGAIGGLLGMGTAGAGAVALGHLVDKSGRLSNLPLPLQLALGGATGFGAAMGGLHVGSRIGRHIGRRRWQNMEKKGMIMNDTMVMAFLNELDEIEKDAGWLRKSLLGLSMAGALAGGGKSLASKAAIGGLKSARPAITQVAKQAPSASRLMVGGATRQARQLHSMGVMP